MLWYSRLGIQSNRIAWIRHDASDECQTAAKKTAAGILPLTTDPSRFRSRRSVLRAPARHVKPKVFIVQLIKAILKIKS